MIITIDGPTASGKSTLAQLVSEQLSFYYLNSGFLYRGLSYILMQKKIHENEVQNYSQDLLKEILDSNKFLYEYDPKSKVKIIFDNNDITKFLKTPEIDKYSSSISKLPIVRLLLLDFQRNLAKKNSLVAEGRDCGTVVFPNAHHKFFLTASLEVRAQRWQKDQMLKGNNFSLQEAMLTIDQRDTRDTKREISPCIPAKEAIIIDNSFLNLQETLIEVLKNYGSNNFD
ncbi:(d)CMP kinase [Candidatus Dependentiae bacterium]|nr:(d)CMP kinase [Candidatus Dependentiae bacterium]